MITIYAPRVQDYSDNGLGILTPTKCLISEQAGGAFDIEIEHPMDEAMHWVQIKKGCVVKAPVPMRENPFLRELKGGNYKIYRAKERVAVRTLANGTSPILYWLKQGEECLAHGTVGSFTHVTTASGITGRVPTSSLLLVKESSMQSVVGQLAVRNQFFRLYEVVQDSKTMKIHAMGRHISFDDLGNIVKSYNPTNVPADEAMRRMSYDTTHSELYYHTNIKTRITATWAHRNVIEVLADPDAGILAKTGALLVRDNFDVFVLAGAEQDRGVLIEHGKNLLGVKAKVTDANVITRIMPIGRRENGEELLLPEVTMDSSHIGDYPIPRAKVMQVDASTYADMRQKAKELFDQGCDLPDIDIDVDFIHLGDTEEYAQYRQLQQVYLHDVVRVRHEPFQMDFKARVQSYEFDAITGRYTKMQVGNLKQGAELGTIAAFQLPTGGISNMKLMPGSVDSRALRFLSVHRAHISEAAVTTLNADAIAAIKAHIQELSAGNVTTDHLYAALATIAAAQITTANIEKADIDWAHIRALSATVAELARAQINSATLGEANIVWADIEGLMTQVATVAKAQINTANIQNADINWAQIENLNAAMANFASAAIKTADIDLGHIKDLTTDTAIITRGVGNELYISRLAVTEANMASLTVGELVVKGEDGRFYSVQVDENGNVSAEIKQVSNDDVQDLSINGDTKLIEGSVTAKTLNAENIFARNAVIKGLIAANLDVDTLFAREAMVGKIDTAHLKAGSVTANIIHPDARKELILAASAGVEELEERVEQAEIKITPDAIVQTVTESDPYTELTGRVATAEQAIRPDSIVQTVRSSNQYMADLDQKANAADLAGLATEDYVQALSRTTLEQTDERLLIQIEQERQRAQSVEGEIKRFTDIAQTYFEFTLDGLLIGKGDSPFKSLAGNEKYSFLQDGVEVAYVQYNKLYILSAHILELLTVGNQRTGYTDVSSVQGGLKAKWRAN